MNKNTEKATKVTKENATKVKEVVPAEKLNVKTAGVGPEDINEEQDSI